MSTHVIGQQNHPLNFLLELAGNPTIGIWMISRELLNTYFSLEENMHDALG